MRNTFLTFALMLFACNCFSGQRIYNPGKLPTDVTKVIVQEVKQTTTYTYLRVKKDSLGVLLNDTLWIALPKIDAAAGDVYYYDKGFMMKDFKSKELNRTFAEIIFLGRISKTPSLEQMNTSQTNPHSTDKADTTKYTKPANTKIDIKIDSIAGGKTIRDLFSNKSFYSGNTVKVKGKVTKFTAKIMGKNWIHLQDGTEYDGKYDLTITTDQVVTAGDIITLEGKVVLNKDYGFGYYYDLILEEGKLVK